MGDECGNRTAPVVQASSPSWVASLGPGLITGAADDDPSGIATYSQAGAKLGYAILWSVLFTYPLMVAIQLISARIGSVSGHGLATNIGRLYPKWLLYFIVSLLLVANTINIAADISAMGQAATLVAGGSARLYAVLFGVVSAGLQIFIPYRQYVRFLKWLTLALFAYVATAFAIPIPWASVLRQTLMPAIDWSPDYMTTIVAVFGTTISPYLFFWQASQEVEELHSHADRRPLKGVSRLTRAAYLSRQKVDTIVGMGMSNLVAFFIILTTAATLHMHGVRQIETSAQAALALRPIAGDFAFFLFSAGIIGTGFLSIPVLAGASAYALAGALKLKNSLNYKPVEARGFYGIIAISTLVGCVLDFTGIDPIKALYWSAVLNGVISVPIMILTMLMASRPEIMGRFTLGWRLRALGWLATLVMAAAVSAMFVV